MSLSQSRLLTADPPAGRERREERPEAGKKEEERWKRRSLPPPKRHQGRTGLLVAAGCFLFIKFFVHTSAANLFLNLYFAWNCYPQLCYYYIFILRLKYLHSLLWGIDYFGSEDVCSILVCKDIGH